MMKRWRDAPSICVGRDVIGILLVELERKTRKKKCTSNVIIAA
jgi:hypothetical protein